MSFCFVIAFTASAWGPSGHRIIGEMSESLLDKKVRQRITALFDNASVAMISNWGDFVRNNPAYDSTSVWHYSDMEANLSRAAFDTLALKKIHGENIYRVVSLTAYLKQHPNDTNMLKMLVHLIEDMHCPMHLGYPEDQGGNKVRIKWQGSERSLHSLWDDAIVDFQKLSYTEYATHLMRVNKLQKINFNGQTSMILDWAWETYAAVPVIYHSADKTGNAYKYNYEYLPLLESRLTKAAEHLAAVLNYIYK